MVSPACGAEGTSGLQAFLSLDATAKIRFFEGPRTPTPYESRRYLTSFPAQQTRFIWWELYLEFPETTSSEVTFPVTAKWYDAQNRLIRTQQVMVRVQPQWDWAAFAQGFGNDTAGVWAPGIYRVVLSIQNYQVAEGAFTITTAGAAGPSEAPPPSDITVESLQFFEAGKDPIPLEQRTYSRQFTAGTTRFIRWQLNLAHPGPRASRQDLPLTALWFGPDGTLIRTQQFTSSLAPDWESSYHGQGLGSPTPGVFWNTMPPGTYRVVIKSGNRVLVTESFELVKEEGAGPAPDELYPGLKGEVVYFNFYEGGSAVVPEDDIKFSRKFVISKTRYIKWELGLSHPQRRSRRLELPLTQEWYGPDGKRLVTHTFTSIIEPGWKSSRHTGRYGSDTPGNWEPGTYRVVVKLDGRELAQGTFELVAEETGAAPAAKDLLSEIGVQVLGLRFFSSGPEPPPLGSRNYSKIFPAATTQYVFWELHFSTNQAGRRVNFQMEDIWYAPEERVLEKGNDTYYTLPTAETYARAGYGYKVQGRWKPGTYKVVLRIQGQEVARGTFEITGPGDDL
jgi:hypothetical protein